MRVCPTCDSRFTNEVRFCPHDGQPLTEVADEVEVDPLLGHIIDGRYRIDQVLGEGGMGIVYLATHTALNKRMALKVLRGDMARDEGIIQRFIQEAQASSSIGHANIINISDFGRMKDGAAYFVMEFLDGVSLTDRIRQTGRLPVHEAVHITTQIASALGAAHTRGIVHRDLKPDNVQLVTRGSDQSFVKVLDFGIAKVGGSNSKLTKTGMVFGTPHYMSPEQAAGQSVDNRADIYALGVILFEMLTGAVPFDGDTFMGILSKHMFEPPPRPSDVAGSDLGPLEPIVLRALCKKPEERYPTMDALVEDLRIVGQGGTVEFQAPSVAPAPNLGVLAQPSEPPTLPRSRLPIAVGIATGVLLLLGVGAGAIAALSSDDSGPEAVAPPPIPTQPPPPTPAAAEPPQVREPAAPQAPEENTDLVLLESSPSGADVLIDGVLIGNTPLTLPRPAAGVTRTAEVRMAGYESRQVAVSDATGDRVLATLEQQRRARRRPRIRDPFPAAAAPPSPQPEPMMVRPRMTSVVSVHSEVVDPWDE